MSRSVLCDPLWVGCARLWTNPRGRGHRRGGRRQVVVTSPFTSARIAPTSRPWINRPTPARRDAARSAASRRSSASARSARSAAPTSISTAGSPAATRCRWSRRTRAPAASGKRTRSPHGAQRNARIHSTEKFVAWVPGFRLAPGGFIRATGPCWTFRPVALITAPACLKAPPLRHGPGAQVAQLVEHVTENHGVGGSIPPLGTILLRANALRRIYVKTIAVPMLAALQSVLWNSMP